MATVIAGEASGGWNVFKQDIAQLQNLVWQYRDATYARGDLSSVNEPKAVYELYGSGITYVEDRNSPQFGVPTGGTFTRLTGTYDGSMIFDIRNFNVPVTTFVSWIMAGDNNAYRNTVFGGDDIFLGSSGPDVLQSFGGNDRIDGRAGADAMDGGPGNDTFVADNLGDYVTDAEGGIDTVESYVSWQLIDGLENLTLLGSAVIGIGNDAANTIIGNAADNDLRGMGGVDTTVYEAAFRQYAVNSAATTTVSGLEGNDTLTTIENLLFVDGRLTFDPNDHMGQAYRLYFATLDRAPDSLGLNYQSARLDAGTSLVEVADGFVKSPEFQATYGALNDRQFVTQLYQNVLDRFPTNDEITYHVGRLKSGASRADVVVGFSESPEHIQKHIGEVNAGLWDIDEGLASISRLYFGMLERTPETAGLTYYKEELANGLTVQEVANGFANSPEFQNKYGPLTNPDYVKQLYLNVLDRAPSADEVAFHVGRLDNGATRGDVAAGFTESLEYQVKTLPLVDDGIAVADAGFILT